MAVPPPGGPGCGGSLLGDDRFVPAGSQACCATGSGWARRTGPSTPAQGAPPPFPCLACSRLVVAAARGPFAARCAPPSPRPRLPQVPLYHAALPRLRLTGARRHGAPEAHVRAGAAASAARVHALSAAGSAQSRRVFCQARLRGAASGEWSGALLGAGPAARLRRRGIRRREGCAASLAHGVQTGSGSGHG